MVKTLLCIPPDYDYNFPPLGTPALAAFLKRAGLAVRQVDLNLRYRDFLLRRITGTDDIQLKKYVLKTLLKKFFRENLKDTYYSDMLVRDSDGIFPYLPYDNNTNSSFYFTERLLSSEHLWRYLADSRENTFYQFFQEEKILDFLDREKINMLGLSIISPSQAIPSLTLGLLVKQHLPHIHVTIGGQWPTLYRNAIADRAELFRCFDSMIMFEGETALRDLILSLQSTGRVGTIPKVLVKGDRLDPARTYPEEDVNQLPCPDFDGLELRDYDGADDVGVLPLTYETSRGCYWNKCAYCVDLPLPKPTYRRKHPEIVARDMKELRQRYRAGHFMLGDPGMSPRQMSEASRELLRQDSEAGWWCMARLEPGFTPEIFARARQAGLKKINFGFESACDRRCDFLHKGNKKDISHRVITDCASAGITVDLQTMVGLPGETFTEGLETIDFLVQHKRVIDSVTFNIYYLTPGNYVYENPRKYGIEFDQESVSAFQFFIPFKNSRGISRNEACLLQQLYGQLSAGPAEAAGDTEGNPAASFAPDIIRGHLRLSLNEQSSLLLFLCREKSGEYIFLNEFQEKAAQLLLQYRDSGRAVSEIIRAFPGSAADFQKFIAQAAEKKFLSSGA